MVTTLARRGAPSSPARPRASSRGDVWDAIGASWTPSRGLGAAVPHLAHKTVVRARQELEAAGLVERRGDGIKTEYRRAAGARLEGPRSPRSPDPGHPGHLTRVTPVNDPGHPPQMTGMTRVIPVTSRAASSSSSSPLSSSSSLTEGESSSSLPSKERSEDSPSEIEDESVREADPGQVTGVTVTGVRDGAERDELLLEVRALRAELAAHRAETRTLMARLAIAPADQGESGAVPTDAAADKPPRRAKARKRLWGAGLLDASEERTLKAVERICAPLTPGAMKKKLDDACCYDYELVARACSDVELRRAGAGKPFDKGPAANLWNAITRPSHGFVEGANANWASHDEVVEGLRRARDASVDDPLRLPRRAPSDPVSWADCVAEAKSRGLRVPK